MKANYSNGERCTKKKESNNENKNEKNNIQDYLENKYQKLTGQKRG